MLCSQVWLGRVNVHDPELAALQMSSHFELGYATYAALFRYTPPRQTLQLAWDYGLANPVSPIGYYVRLGHGGHSCPEIYTRTKGRSSLPSLLVMGLRDSAPYPLSRLPSSLFRLPSSLSSCPC